MKKKTRSITVNDKKYTWRVAEDDWPNGTLKVWVDGTKNNMLLGKKVLVSEPVRPSRVADIIEKALLDME